MVTQKGLCEICSPKQWKTISLDMLLDSGYPVYGANGIIGYYSEFNHITKTLLITCRGATCGSLNICEPYSYVNGNAMALDDLSDDVDIQYLYYYLQHRGFLDVITGSAQPQIVRQSLEKIHVTYPEIERQKKIVISLDKISNLISLRKQQLAKLDELVKARFVEMFGDPVVNPKGWLTKPLLDMGYCKNGMNFRTGDSGVKIHCLGVGDFKDLSVIDGTSQLPMISLNEEPPQESMLQDGDIVFVRSNGNKALVGRCLVVYPRDTPTTYSGFCIRYRMYGKDVEIQYLIHVLKTDSMRRKMAGRGANIQNLNQQILSTLNIPIPPAELQQQFAAFVEQTDETMLTIQQSLDKLEVLKRASMQEYFG